MMSGGRIWTWFEGKWIEGEARIISASDHGAWLGSMVFDGARSFEGRAPDLEAHCARVNESARKMGLATLLSNEDIVGLCREGLAKFGPGAETYIRPMMWARDGSALMVAPDPDSTALAICIEERPMPGPNGLTLTTTSYRRPSPDSAPTYAKAGCLYPNNARMLVEAKAKGFMNAVSLDPIGNVAETATSNLFIVRDGVAQTPSPNGSFLAGITRSRIIELLRDDGVEVEETVLSLDDVRAADEIFTTGNALKVMHATQFEERHLQWGPIARRARELYWDWSAGTAAV
ncbi:MAG: branched-chain amino acid aminotransferase [Pseudomonadota bacterium]